jgi:long-chain fatty acid transport protein
MNTILKSAALLAMTTTLAQAGGIDRSGLSYAILFEEGQRAEIGFSRVNPTVTGTYRAALGGGSTGDMAGGYNTFSLSYKADFGDKLSFGVFAGTPYGADANYSAGAYTGLRAQWDSKQVAGILRYKITPAISVYGGLRLVNSKANINIPDALIRGGLAAAGAAGNAQAAALAAGAPAGSLAYSADGTSDSQVGYIIGAAFEKPEIALRVGLTYESGVTHEFATVERIAAVPSITGGTTTVEMPQSIKLDFQSGVAKDTLVFGSIRWSEWSVWEVRPQGYNALTGQNITDFDNNVLSYQLGVGRRLNDNLSVFARVGYEKSNGGIASRLAPTDGSKSFGIGGSYTKDKMKITGGVEYVKLGDAVDGSGTVFSGAKAIGLGVSVAFSF